MDSANTVTTASAASAATAAVLQEPATGVARATKKPAAPPATSPAARPMATRPATGLRGAFVAMAQPTTGR